MSGSSGKDDIYGGDGNDIIAGGAGSDNIKGGAGNDFIVSAETLNIAQRVKPSDSWSAPVGATVLASGSNWGAYTQGGIVYWNRPSPIAVDDAPDVVDAGAGDDVVFGGRGDDYIQGGLGLDSLTGGGGNDIIEGGDDADRIAGDDVAANGLAAELNRNDFSKNASYLGADGSIPSMATARIYCTNRHHKPQKQRFQRGLKFSDAETAHACSMRLAGHKGLGRRVGSGVATSRRTEWMTPGPREATQINARNEAGQ